MKRSLMLSSAIGLLAAIAAASAAPVGRWQGFYVGASAGYGDHQARYEDPLFDWNGASPQFHANGAIYGGQVGYNWQMNNVAMGLEADFMGTDISRDTIYSADDFIPNEVNWMASLRVRKGFAFGDTFIYDTVGLGFADFDRSWTEALDFSDSWPDLGDSKLGVVAGFGVERALGGNWSARAEALAFHFFSNTSVNPDGFPLVIDDTIFTLRAGVNYAFGDQRSGPSQFVAGKPFDFSGFFLGGSLGGHMATVQLTDIEYNDFGSTLDLLSNGVAGGVQAGYNTQINGFVYGLEANFNVLGGDESITNTFSGDDTFDRGGLNWSGDIKFKAGVAADDTLMYLSAGYAFADYDLRHRNDSDGDAWDLDGTHSGFIAGTGIEHGFTPNITGRLEATYAAYDGDTVASPTNSDRFRGAAQDVTLMAGVNYYFGDRGSMGSGALAPADWKGFYAGPDAIFAYHQSTIFDRSYFDHGGNYTVPSFGGGLGAHAGYDWQNDSFVYGVIGDAAFYSNDEDDTSPGYRRISSTLNWMGSLRARAGVATGQALFYATGGVAYGDIDVAYDYLPTPDPDSYHFDSSRWGWVIGLGVEKMMSDRSSFKFETLFTKFDQEGALNGSTCSDNLTTEACQMLADDATITVKVGYSLRWGTP